VRVEHPAVRARRRRRHEGGREGGEEQGGVLDAHGGAPFPAWVTDVVLLGVPTVALVVGLLMLEQRTRPPEHPRRPQGGR
jgi:hypothetical protein